MPDNDKLVKDKFGTPRGISPPKYGIGADDGKPKPRKFEMSNIPRAAAQVGAELVGQLNPVNMARRGGALAGAQVGSMLSGEGMLTPEQKQRVLEQSAADPELVGPADNPWLSGETSSQLFSEGLRRGEGIGGALAGMAQRAVDVLPRGVTQTLAGDTSVEELEQMLAAEAAENPRLYASTADVVTDAALLGAGARGIRGIKGAPKAVPRTVTRPSARMTPKGPVSRAVGDVVQAPPPAAKPGVLGQALSKMASAKPEHVPILQRTGAGMTAALGQGAARMGAQGALKASKMLGVGQTRQGLAEAGRRIPGALATGEGGYESAVSPIGKAIGVMGDAAPAPQEAPPAEARGIHPLTTQADEADFLEAPVAEGAPDTDIDESEFL